MEEIRITLETLYDILRNEKKREDLQKLEDTFFIDVVNYLQEKKKLLDSKQDENELFAAGEKKKLEYELDSIKRILKEIYERREKKIIDISLNRSRTGSDIIDTSAMLREEKQFYQELLETLDDYRRGVLLNLFKGELPDVEKTTVKTEVQKEASSPMLENNENHLDNSAETHAEEAEDIPHLEEPKISKETEKNSPLENKETKDETPLTTNNSENEQKIELTKIKFTHPTPSFVWKDMKVYGPFEKDDETDIFPEVADLLVRKGRAEKV